MNADQRELAQDLLSHPKWQWRDGMRRVDAKVRHPDGQDDLPDLLDWATAGAMLGLLDDLGVLVEVAREAEEGFIVAVETSEGLKGWVGDTLGEAAAWALLHLE